MYHIGNIIVGTYLPWEATDYRDDVVRKVALAYATQETIDRLKAIDRLEPDCSVEDLEADADNGDHDFWLDSSPWNREYHGGSDGPVAWVGVQIGEFDVTDHLPLSELDVRPTPEQVGKAREAYDSLPEAVRGLLPEFGVYVVWSTS